MFYILINELVQIQIFTSFHSSLLQTRKLAAFKLDGFPPSGILPDNVEFSELDSEYEWSNFMDRLTPVGNHVIPTSINTKSPTKPKNEDDTGVNVENHNVFRLPPPITIGNVNESNKLLKKLQDITMQKLRRRIIGKGLRVYPETPEAYHAIRRYFDSENLEAFTYQLNEKKELKAVEGKKELRYPTSRNYRRPPDLWNYSQRILYYVQQKNGTAHAIISRHPSQK
ncbi:hypothetical protein TNCV_4548201 [Trichonephila clavipes]|nr:hypothetical protein TNCV_4548201 [Trichonephila clavipes]